MISIIGGSGFVGSFLIKQLIDCNVQNLDKNQIKSVQTINFPQRSYSEASSITTCTMSPVDKF